jgi:hypothetical protein
MSDPLVTPSTPEADSATEGSTRVDPRHLRAEGEPVPVQAPVLTPVSERPPAEVETPVIRTYTRN